MPKHEFDPDDPMELVGVGLFTDEDTTDEMTECFIQEFMRMGYNHKQLLALFCNPFYTAPNSVLQNRGDRYVRNKIAEEFAKWGRSIVWPEHECNPAAETSAAPNANTITESACGGVDPLGAPAPEINL